MSIAIAVAVGAGVIVAGGLDGFIGAEVGEIVGVLVETGAGIAVGTGVKALVGMGVTSARIEFTGVTSGGAAEVGSAGGSCLAGYEIGVDVGAVAGVFVGFGDSVGAMTTGLVAVAVAIRGGLTAIAVGMTVAITTPMIGVFVGDGFGVAV